MTKSQRQRLAAGHDALRQIPLACGGRDSLARLGADLEELLEDLPEAASSSLAGCLMALQRIYEEMDREPAALREAAVQVLGALGSRDDTDEVSLDRAEADLAFLLEGPYGPHELAALLVALEPADAVGLARFGLALRYLDAGLSAAVRRQLAHAAARFADQNAREGAGEPLLLALTEDLEKTLAVLDGESAGDDEAPAADAGKAADSQPEISQADAPGKAAALSMSPELDATLVEDYLAENRELLADAEAALLELEADAGAEEALHRVFRAFHTVKGSSAFLGLEAIAKLAHAAESLLARVRDGNLAYGPGVADLCLRSVDRLASLLQGVEDLLEGKNVPLTDSYSDLLNHLDKFDAALPPAPQTAPGGGQAPSLRGAPAKALRVRTERLDALIELVGELVIAQASLTEDAEQAVPGGGALREKLARAQKTARELQDLSLSLRMVPLANSFRKLTRLVRDLASKSGKSLRFVCEGEETEIDRNLVDLIGDPLVHMIRNAVDHGIEDPVERRAAGKSPEGELRLVAQRAGDSVLLTLADDGRGLDRRAIVAKAIDRGLIQGEAGLSDGEIFSLIFEPGFSTASQVTEVSGRGVGMDVVRRNIESLHGQVQIESTPGRGTRFTLRLPLTLAIAGGMLLRVADQRFIAPMTSIRATLRLEGQRLSHVAQRGELLQHQGDVLPLFRLHRLMGIPRPLVNQAEGAILVLDDGDQPFALAVDELLGTLQVVVKPLGEGLDGIPGLAGGAILGDGRVSLILDPAGLAKLARRGETTSQFELARQGEPSEIVERIGTDTES